MPPDSNPRPGLHLVFHHFGLAVRRPQEAVSFLSAQGYAIGETVLDPQQNVHLKLCTHPTEPAVEIIWPGQGPGPLDAMIQKRPEGIIYHLCYVTTDLDSTLTALKAAHLNPICISPPKPAPLFGGREVSFYNIVGMGLVEMLQGAVEHNPSS